MQQYFFFVLENERSDGNFHVIPIKAKTMFFFLIKGEWMNEQNEKNCIVIPL